MFAANLGIDPEDIASHGLVIPTDPEPGPRHDGPVNAVAVGTLPTAPHVIVTGGDDGTVRIWRSADGTPVGNPLVGHIIWVPSGPPLGLNATIVYPVQAGRRALRIGPATVSGGGDGTGKCGGLPTAPPSGTRCRLTARWRRWRRALQDGIRFIVTGGDRAVRVWRLADGTPVRNPHIGHDGGVRAVAVGALQDGTPLIVTAAATARCGYCGWLDARSAWVLISSAARSGTVARPRRPGGGGGGRGAAGRPGDRQLRRGRHGAGVAAGSTPARPGFSGDPAHRPR